MSFARFARFANLRDIFSETTPPPRYAAPLYEYLVPRPGLTSFWSLIRGSPLTPSKRATDFRCARNPTQAIRAPEPSRS